MPDTEISRLQELPASLVEADDVLAIVDDSADETKKVPAVALAQRAIELIPDDSIPTDKIDWDDGIESVINGSAIADRSIEAVKLAINTITASEIAPNAIGPSELAELSVSTDTVQPAAITNDKLASGIDGSKLNSGSVNTEQIAENAITENELSSNSVGGDALQSNSVSAENIAANAVGASELADASVDTNAIQTDAVTNLKIASGIDGGKLSAGSVNTSQIAANAITSSQLSNDSVDTNALISDSVTAAKLSPDLNGDDILAAGSINTALAENSVRENELAVNAVYTSAIQNGAVTNSKLASNIDGAKLNNGSVPATALDPNAFSDGIVLDGTVKIDNAITAGTRNGISFNAQGLITSTAELNSDSLPIATASSVGGVSVPASGGLGVTNTGAISINNTISAGTTSGISFNSKGLITSTTGLTGSDLPPSTNVTLGGVIVPTTNNNPLLVDGSGNLTHSTSGVAAGSYVNVAVNTYGLVTGGSDTLNANQVPSLDAGKITTGQFTTPRIADDAITMQKLADYSVAFIQEAQPAFSQILHIGCTWYQPSTAQLRMYDGNVWAPIGFGRLSQENLRFGGVVDGSTGNVVNLTDAGRTAGLAVGDPLPAATDALGGLYLVVSPGGSNISVVPSTTFDAGDWCLCINATDSWIRIDTLSSGGGSGGLIRLNDLLDVDINSPQAGDTLIYDPVTSNWINRTTTADRVTLSPAFDGSTTAFTTSMDILDQNNMLLSVGGVLLEPGVDFQIATGTRQLNFASPPPAGSTYFAINQQTVNAGGGGGGGTDLPPGSAENEYLQWNNSLGSWGPSTELNGGSY